jgi:membrane protein
MALRGVWPLLKQTFAEWSEDEVPRLAAALSYYTVFALAPVLVVITAIASLVFDSASVRAEVLGQMHGLLGPAGAELVGSMLDAAGRSRGSVAALIAGVLTTLFAASGLFGELQAALNRVWEVKPRRGRGVLGLVKDRFLSFTMVLGVGFVMLVSLVVSAGLAAAGKYAAHLLPRWDAILQALNAVVGVGIATLLFAMIYKVLPDVKLRWRDVWLGALVTAALFTIGRVLIGLYLGRTSVGSTFGAAGSLAIILLWVYYSSQILLIGAEFTQVHTRWRGAWVEPREQAEIEPGAWKGTVKGSEGEASPLHGTGQAQHETAGGVRGGRDDRQGHP